MLVHNEIIRAKEKGWIDIDPWDPSRIGPNSYDVTLSPVVKRYRHLPLDSRATNLTSTFDLPVDGYQLLPGTFLLGATNEYCSNHSRHLIPMIDGVSSLGRLSLNVHATAGLGNVGFCGTWTLELFTIIPVILYPNMRIAQLYWEFSEVPLSVMYSGRYLGQIQPTESIANGNPLPAKNVR